MEDRRGPTQEHEDKAKDRKDDKQSRAKKFGFLAGADNEAWSGGKHESDDDDDEEESEEKTERSKQPEQANEDEQAVEEGRWAAMMRSIFERDQESAQDDEQTSDSHESEDDAGFSIRELSFLRPKQEQQELDQTEPEEREANDEEEIELPPIDVNYSIDHAPEEPDEDEPVGPQASTTRGGTGRAGSAMGVPAAGGHSGAGGGHGGGSHGAGAAGFAGGGGGGIPPLNHPNNPNMPNPAAPNQLHNNPNTNNHDPRLRKAIAGLLLVDAIDYLTSKRRENKIKKKNEADHKKLGAAQDRQQLAHNQLEKQTRKLDQARQESQERLEKLEEDMAQRSKERAAPVSRPKIPAEVLRVVQEISEVTEKTHEKLIESQDHELLATLTERDREILKTEILERPGDVLEAVKRAAEKKAALETLYEKRHESRGNESTSQAMRSGASQSKAHANTLEQFAAWSGQQSLSTDVKLPEVPVKPQLQSTMQQQVARTVTTVLIIFVILVVFAIILLM